jgi:hypothetical protein
VRPLLAAVDDLDALYDDLVLGGPRRARRHGWRCAWSRASTARSRSATCRAGSGDRPTSARSRRVRDACDVILVGAGTVRDEDYPPYPGGAARRQRRSREGPRPRPPVAMVTRTGALPDGHPLVADPDDAPIVIVARAGRGARARRARPDARRSRRSAGSSPARRARLADGARRARRARAHAHQLRGWTRASTARCSRRGSSTRRSSPIAPALVGGDGLRLTRTDAPRTASRPHARLRARARRRAAAPLPARLSRSSSAAAASR